VRVVGWPSARRHRSSTPLRRLRFCAIGLQPFLRDGLLSHPGGDLLDAGHLGGVVLSGFVDLIPPLLCTLKGHVEFALQRSDVVRLILRDLALEDGAQRLQSRARMLLDDEPLPEDFHFMTKEDVYSALAEGADWAQGNWERKTMVIVDTLEKVRAPRGSNGYEDDYSAGTSLQRLLTKGGCVVAVHHTRKAESEDFLDAVSGTFSVTGRDVEEMVYSLTFEDGVWTVDGTDAQAANKVTEQKLGTKMRAVLELVTSRDQTTAADVMAAHPCTSDAGARQCLWRLAEVHGLIVRISAGIYGPVTVSQVSQDPGPADEDGIEFLDSDGDAVGNQSREQVALSSA
jgi:hypothetical protein